MNEIYKKTASLILGYLTVRFVPNYKNDEKHQAKQTLIWAEELGKKVDADRLTEDNIKSACDLWANVNGKGFPPTIDQFINCILKINVAPVVVIEVKEEKSKDYLRLWNDADDHARFRFFADHAFNKVPQHIHVMFMRYMESTRGWTYCECKKMIDFHMSPFEKAGHGAILEHQREVLDYFKNRKVA